MESIFLIAQEALSGLKSDILTIFISAFVIMIIIFGLSWIVSAFEAIYPKAEDEEEEH